MKATYFTLLILIAILTSAQDQIIVEKRDTCALLSVRLINLNAGFEKSKKLSVNNQYWYKASIAHLIGIKDQIVLPELNLLYDNISAIDIYRVKGWDAYQYSYIRKVSLEIERREDNRDW